MYIYIYKERERERERGVERMIYREIDMIFIDRHIDSWSVYIYIYIYI